MTYLNSQEGHSQLWQLKQTGPPTSGGYGKSSEARRRYRETNGNRVDVNDPGRANRTPLLKYRPIPCPHKIELASRGKKARPPIAFRSRRARMSYCTSTGTCGGTGTGTTGPGPGTGMIRVVFEAYHP
jgi:hypothetical protein